MNYKNQTTNHLTLIACILVSLTILASCQQKEEAKRYPILLNMVHHNPGEPQFETKYTEPAYLKELGYTGQVPKVEAQCGLTYDRWKKNVVPEKSNERLWIERHAATVRTIIDNAERANMPLYPFTDVLVLPKSIMEKYGEEMKIDGRLSIMRERTQEILRAQIDEMFWRYPKLQGLTIRFGETYLHDTPYHKGMSPVKTEEEHAVMINILREEVCVKRDKKLFYRTWDFYDFHIRPEFYLKATNAVKPHENLYFSIKHVNADFLRGYPFNTTIGIGKHQQIIELSVNQAGCYGKNSHPYYIGKGIIENWSEMDDKKGIRDLYDDPKIKGFWTWTWGDGWAGPYFNNELWVDLNEFVLRDYALNPKQSEEDIFFKYAKDHLKLSSSDAKKLRELCLISTDAVYYGQLSKHFKANPWWFRDHFIFAMNLDEVVEKGIQDKVLKEKQENLESWKRMEQLSREIKMDNPDDQTFLQVSTTYGRIKYEVIALVWEMQTIIAEQKAGLPFDKESVANVIKTYENKWKEWVQLKEDNPSCPTLYLDNYNRYSRDNIQRSIQKLEEKL